MISDITDQYLVKLYDDLQREQQRLLTEMKNLEVDNMSKETEINKQITLVNNLMTNSLKLRNLKKKLLNKHI